MHTKYIIIHTEEEFEWNGSYSSENNKVSHGDALFRIVKELLESEINIILTLDFAFVDSENGLKCIEKLLNLKSPFLKFGTHLHPWVNPPFFEEDYKNVANSFACNLPTNLEKEKISYLSSVIEKITGEYPIYYLGGRYGTDEDTLKILCELNYMIDFSISPFMNYSKEGGPDFTHYDNSIRIESNITRIPHTTGIISRAMFISRFLNKNPRWFHALNNTLSGKVILKLFNVKLVRLSPEGYSFHEMKTLVDTLVPNITDTLVLSFHSPSVVLGLTPYVTSGLQHQTFIDDLKKIVRYIKNV